MTMQADRATFSCVVWESKDRASRREAVRRPDDVRQTVTRGRGVIVESRLGQTGSVGGQDLPREARTVRRDDRLDRLDDGGHRLVDAVP